MPLAHYSANTVHAPNMSERYRCRFFLTSELEQRRFSIRRHCSSAGNTVHAWETTVHAWKPLFTRRSYCSSMENHRGLWKMLFIHAARRFPLRFIIFKQASLATNLMTRRCRVFASPFLRLLSLKGYAELFRSAAHLLLSNQVLLFLPVRAVSIDFSVSYNQLR